MHANYITNVLKCCSSIKNRQLESFNNDINATVCWWIMIAEFLEDSIRVQRWNENFEDLFFHMNVLCNVLCCTKNIFLVHRFISNVCIVSFKAYADVCVCVCVCICVCVCVCVYTINSILRNSFDIEMKIITAATRCEWLLHIKQQ